MNPTANELLERVGLSPRPGGDEVRIPVTEAAWESDEFMNPYVASRVHLFIDLHLRDKTKKELLAVHGAAEAFRDERFYKIEAIQQDTGEPIKAVVEWNGEVAGVDAPDPEQAKWFGAGQLRGMGFLVRDVTVTEMTS